MEERRALVTGGTGFIGRALCHYLVADGWDVHLVVRVESRLTWLDSITKRVTVHVHDASTEGMLAIVRKASPTTVFHLAALFLSEHKPADIESLVRSNILFGSQLLEAMVTAGATKLVNTGTSWQHLGNHEYDPVCLYAATKQAFEAMVTFYVNSSPLRAVTLKLFDTYGPNDPRNKLFSLLRRAAITQVPLAMSPGEQMVDLVYVDDVVAAYRVAAQLLKAAEVKHACYSVSSGAAVRLREVVELYSRIAGLPVPVEWGTRTYRVREVMVPWNRGALLPGWYPKTTLEEGIKKMEGILR